MEGCKGGGIIVKATGYEKYLNSSFLNSYEQGKIQFVKTREKDVTEIKMYETPRFLGSVLGLGWHGH